MSPLKMLSLPLLLTLLAIPESAKAQSTTATQGTASAAAKAPAKERTGGGFGAGLLLGSLNGASLKGWDGDTHGIQFRLGSGGLNSFALSVTYEHHLRPLTVTDRSFSLPFYVGGGLRFKVDGDQSPLRMEGGLEGVAGMSIMVPDLPVEVFMEARPSVVLYNRLVGTEESMYLGFQVEGGVGVHYYF